MENSRLKFRAWDVTVGGKMEYCGLERCGDYHEPMGHVLMQYTGLKDKNGKEVYESDVLKDENCSGILGQVVHGDYFDGEYQSYGWHLDNIKSLDDEFDIKNRHCEKLTPFYCKDDCEIIGNIYENPELLTTSNGDEPVHDNTRQN